ncbi:MAG: 50S ribosomal protein L25 [Candidatus Moranbacteria bacterium GW2011_GWF2_36_839]|nr:MAG: 50S ribosomal protein L25 [Candidatus Moranbacteria bacterium GW2011_GWF1_36_78]KKQ17264.1 MAG: 50S ribosomal protein L25 [Candidatus Moranbacteria bacterium GW2011_GWF2_36_839]HAT73893.1 50S ribosomal protein L25 [Candidatus Moranbacteria bacterium]HBY10964.1 50S ribosomal protein L25 [Candidatus Moranbacteria bacterium]
MDKVKLIAKTREVFGRKTKAGKKEGLFPAVVYGKKVTPKSLWVNAIEFAKLLRVSGESTMIELDIDEKDKRNVIIYEIQKDPVMGNIIHTDFFQVRMDEEIEKAVEVIYVGEAPAVKELGGVLVKSLDEITVKCLPADLPSEIEVDITSLKTFEDHICIKDLKISPKVKIELEPETVVALVSPPRSEEELTGLSEKVEADVTKVEGVIKKEKPAEGEEAKKEETKK